MVFTLNWHSVLCGAVWPLPRSSALLPTGLPLSPVMEGSNAFSCGTLVSLHASGQPDGGPLGLIVNGPTLGADVTLAWFTSLSFGGNRLVLLPSSITYPNG